MEGLRVCDGPRVESLLGACRSSLLVDGLLCRVLRPLFVLSL